MADRGKLTQRLEWLKSAVRGLQMALGEDVVDFGVNVLEGADPISLIVTIPLKVPIQKGSRAPLRQYVREWAKTGDVEVSKIDICDRAVVMQVLIKYLHSKPERFKEEKKMEEDLTLEHAKIVQATPRAVLVESDELAELGESPLWIPQVAIHDDSEIWRKGDVGSLTIKGWWAKKRRLT